jgi:hypothetical protein
VSVRAVNNYFGKKRKADAIIEPTEILDFTGTARFLVFELVARKAQDFQAAISICLKQPLQAVILGSEASFAGHIDNEQDLVPVGSQGGGVAVDGPELKIVNGCHGKLP